MCFYSGNWVLKLSLKVNSGLRSIVWMVMHVPREVTNFSLVSLFVAEAKGKGGDFCFYFLFAMLWHGEI